MSFHPMRAPRGPESSMIVLAKRKPCPADAPQGNSFGSADLIPPSGILGRANARNRNGRVYPKHLLQREASVFYSAHVRMCRALGELDHPPPASPTFRSLNLANVSHQVLDYHWQGDDLMGYVEVLPTHAGVMLRDLYVAGNRLGMSSRGWATLAEKDGYVYIQEDFELITFDFVSDPSTDGAYLRPVQRKFEGLKKQIDIKAAYDSFMAQCAGKAIIKATAPVMPVMRTGGSPAPRRMRASRRRSWRASGTARRARWTCTRTDRAWYPSWRFPRRRRRGEEEGEGEPGAGAAARGERRRAG